MKREQLLAPENYNLVEEFERFAKGDGRKAIVWENDQGEKKELTYDELIQQANRAANSFRAAGLKKAMSSWLWYLVSLKPMSCTPAL